ncbi:ESPR-type extended signal peptide-containing protein [[Haemophilus] ducreyi]|uniref:ESPR-type extended signal peptide-containing protein n=1 Tax=Haemophilus ducreyi TaxID=730 RepID=UPI001AD82B00
MNNKRYKLIFSKVKNCLVPVAENIKSASGNSGSSSNSKIAEDQEEEPDSLACSLSPLSSSIHLGASPTFKFKSFACIEAESISFFTKAISCKPCLRVK